MTGTAALAALLAMTFSQAAQAPADACRRSAALTGACRQVHGRLTAYNGNPTFRIWIIGTKRMLGVHGGAPEQIESAEVLPASIRRMLGPNAFETILIGDFTICPLSRARPGHMQYVCVAYASRLHARRP